MVYIPEQIDNQTNYINLPVLLDPKILRAAREIYRTYCEVRTHRTQHPLGVAIDRYTYRGQVIFESKPVLLPNECFVPLEQLESEIK